MPNDLAADEKIENIESVPGGVIYAEALANFLALLHNRDNAYMKTNYPTLHTHSFYPTSGSRYDRIVKDDGVQRSVYCFVDRSTGDILKGSWKQPVAPKVARGNIYNANPLDGTTVYGPKYLR
jgi:hypothetical protein